MAWKGECLLVGGHPAIKPHTGGRRSLQRETMSDMQAWRVPRVLMGR